MATDSEKTIRFQSALDQFVERLKDDTCILAAVLVGSLNDDTVWSKNGLHVWVIEKDGISKRLKADGNDECIERILVEEDINIHAELIPRSRFRQMVEGSSRTAFSCSYFARRKMLYCTDQSIEAWFEKANTFATKDQEKELLGFTSWAIHAHRHARRLFDTKKDMALCKESVVWTAHAIAAMQQIRKGEIQEHDVIYQAIEDNPELFQGLYLDVIVRKPSKKYLQAALVSAAEYLDVHWQANLKPVTAYLKKQKRTVPLSEISEHFAFTQLYPWHLESTCEWLTEAGHIEKVSAPFRLTKKSRTDVEEPAYQWI
ncbi:MAG: hypothetical protein ABJZ55_17155 [Fuerstiella sp.]